MKKISFGLIFILLLIAGKAGAQCTISLSSDVGTDSQTLCIGAPIVTITYITTGTNGASFNNLPAGVNGSWQNDEVTISGTPSESGVFNYSVNLTGCGSTSADGTITVQENTISLSSASGTNNQTLCTGAPITPITYATTGATEATFSGLPPGVSGSWSGNIVTISGSPGSSAGSPYNYTVTLTGGCGSVSADGVINVTTSNTITLSSPGTTTSQTVCTGSPIANITYTTTGATNAIFSGLPPGVTGSWNSNVVTISGAPSSSTGSPFNYTVSLTGGCGNVSANGTIAVTQGNTITLSSAAGTNNQAFCIGTALINITYTTTGATGATFSGLPAGVTGSWSANIVTIFGTPSASGVFNYSVNLTGGCGTVSASGTITVNSLPVATLTSSEPDNSICTGTSVTFTAGGGGAGANYNYFVADTSRQNGPSATYTTNTLINGQRVRVVVTNANNCTSTNLAEIRMIVNSPPFISMTPGSLSCSVDLTTYSFSVIVSTGTVTSTAGTVISTGSNVWSISAIPTGVAVTVRVTDSGGCLKTLDVVAPNCSCPVILAPVSGGDKSYCQNGVIPAINATVLPGETVDWYSAPTGGILLSSASLTYTPAAPGTYYAVARNTTTQCVSSTSTAVTVTATPAPIPVLTSSDADNSFCSGTSIVFTAEGGTNYNFMVGGVSVQNGTQPTFTTTTLVNNDLVSVVVTNATGCSATAAGITNTVIPLPASVLTSSDADNSFCAGTSITFTSGGGTGFNFRVDGLTVQNGASPVYTTNSLSNGQVVDVIVTNSNSCSAISNPITNSVFEIPVISAGTGGNNCGLSFHFNGTLSGGTGIWTKESGPGNVTFTPDANTPNATVDVSAYGNYTFRWTVANGTCAVHETVTIFFIQQSAASAGNGGNECDKDFIFNALPITSGNGTWTKINGPGNPVFTPDSHEPNATVSVDQFGTYDFAWTVVNSTCTSSDIIRVGFHDQPPVSAGVDTAVCKGSSVQLNATGSGTVSWTPVENVSNPSIINPVVTPLITTTYTVQNTDQFGCKNSDDVIVAVWNNPIADAGPDQTIVSANTATMDAAVPGPSEKGHWSVVSGTGIFSDSTYAKTSVENLASGENKMEWAVSNLVCPISRDTANIYVNDFVIPTLITPNMDGKNDYFVLNGLSAAGKTELLVFDRRGIEVYSNPDYDNSWNGVDFNNKPLPEDTYFYALKTKSGRILKGYIVIKR